MFVVDVFIGAGGGGAVLGGKSTIALPFIYKNILY